MFEAPVAGPWHIEKGQDLFGLLPSLIHPYGFVPLAVWPSVFDIARLHECILELEFATVGLVERQIGRVYHGHIVVTQVAN